VSTPTLEISPRELAFREEHGGFSLTLKRNCSISPSGLACVFVALAVVVLAIGTGFAIAGAWLILPFAGLGPKAGVLRATSSMRGACAWKWRARASCCARQAKRWSWAGTSTSNRAGCSGPS